MLTALEAQLPSKTRELLERYGFDLETFLRLQASVVAGPSANVARGTITQALESDLRVLPLPGSPSRTSLAAHGEELLRQGAVAVVILCGGMATRFGGVVKANVPVLDERTFLDLKLGDVEQAAQRAGGRVPVYLMTSFASHAEVSRKAGSRHREDVPVFTFPQFVSLRLTPDGTLFLGADGLPSLYATGHGDLAPALRASGCLAAMADAGVKHIFMTNVDNLAATLDPAVIGAHATSQQAMTFEVTETRPADKGGAPVRVDGKLQVLEAFRLPPNLDPRCTEMFSTNSFVLDVAALDRTFDLSWFRVDKQVDGRRAVQFERLVNELSATLPCQALVVSRQGEDDRFIPIKEPEDLEAQRAHLEQLLRARGSL